MSKPIKTCTEGVNLREGLAAQRRTINPVAIRDIPREEYETFLFDLASQQAAGRYRWRNLPNGLKSYLVEQMLYWRGALCGFPNKDVFSNQPNGDFYILPFAVQDGVNMYGLPNGIKPMPYQGPISNNKPSLQAKRSLVIDATGNYNPKAEAVLLYDRLPRFNGKSFDSRVAYNACIINELAEIMARLHINIVTSTKKVWVKLMSAKQQATAERELDEALGTDKPYVLVAGGYDFTVPNTEISINTQELWEAFSSYMALLMQSLGVQNAGVFNKKERQLVDEVQQEGAETSLIEDAGLEMRQQFINDCLRQWPEMEWQITEVEDGEVIEKTCTWRDVTVESVQANIKAAEPQQEEPKNDEEGPEDNEEKGDNDNE